MPRGVEAIIQGVNGSAECRQIAKLIAEPYGGVKVVAGQWTFKSVACGVQLYRGDYQHGTVLDDEHISVQNVEEWCRANNVSLLTEGVRLIIVSLSSTVDPDFRGWRVAWLIAEALRSAVSQGFADEDPIAHAISSEVARVRWYLLRAVLKADPASPLKVVAEASIGGFDAVIEKARLVRAAWTGYLLDYEDHPKIAGILVDEESRRLLDVSLVAGSGGYVPYDGRQRSEYAFRSLVARELLARRFLIPDLWREFGLLSGTVKWVIPAFFLLVPLLLLAAGGSALAGCSAVCKPLPWAALVAGLLGYLALAIAVPFASERLTYPFLLRFAATSLVGIVFIQSLPSTWLRQVLAGSVWLGVAAGLLLASFAYLVVEARLHGSHKRSAFLRAGMVGGIGMVHGLIGALVYVLIAARLLGPDAVAGSDLAAQLQAVLVVASGAVAAGVLLQVLWEDRPVTYPLGVLRYRRD